MSEILEEHIGGFEATPRERFQAALPAHSSAMRRLHHLHLQDLRAKKAEAREQARLLEPTEGYGGGKTALAEAEQRLSEAIAAMTARNDAKKQRIMDLITALDVPVPKKRTIVAAVPTSSSTVQL